MARNQRYTDDYPMYAKLYIACGKKIEIDELRSHFEEFGTIVDTFAPIDKTGRPRGMAYITYSKTSEAALAMEAMNGKSIPNVTRRLIVNVANSRGEMQSEEHDPEKFKRIFINIPRVYSESDVEQHFSPFGDIVSVIIQRDKDTMDSKGFAYVKYKKFSEAANAVEKSDRKYKAIFAQPKYTKKTETSFEANINKLSDRTNPMNVKSTMFNLMNATPDGYTQLQFMCSPLVTQYHARRLFDIVPGLQDFKYIVDIMRQHGKGLARYSSPIAAAHALEKLHRFEYPPGCPIQVRPDYDNFGGYNQGPSAMHEGHNPMSKVMNTLTQAMKNTTNQASPDLIQLTEAVAAASKLIKIATGGADDSIDSSDLNYCSVRLPEPKPFVHIDTPIGKRCFLVCQPQPPPIKVLKDIFCRFGDLIDVYTLPHKKVGYAQYASTSAADEAIRVLHGAEICGIRIKVLEAEEGPTSNKRMRSNE